MSNAQHTPGPWKLCDRGDYGDFDGDSRVILDADMSIRIAVVHDSGADEAEANAHMIASAPDLLLSLESLIDEIRDLPTETFRTIDANKCNLSVTLSNAMEAVLKSKGEK